MIRIMGGDAKEVETGMGTETETGMGTETGKGTGTTIAPMKIMVGIGREKVGRGTGETEIVGGAGAAQEAGAAAGIVGIVTVRMGTTEGSMPAAVSVP